MAKFNKYEYAKNSLKELGFFTKWNRQVLNGLAESVMSADSSADDSVYLHVVISHVNPDQWIRPDDEESWIAPRRRKSESLRGYKSRLRAWLNLWAADVLHEYNPVTDRVEPCEVTSVEVVKY